MTVGPLEGPAVRFDNVHAHLWSSCYTADPRLIGMMDQ